MLEVLSLHPLSKKKGNWSSTSILKKWQFVTSLYSGTMGEDHGCFGCCFEGLFLGNFSASFFIFLCFLLATSSKYMFCIICSCLMCIQVRDRIYNSSHCLCPKRWVKSLDIWKKMISYIMTKNLKIEKSKAYP